MEINVPAFVTTALFIPPHAVCVFSGKNFWCVSVAAEMYMTVQTFERLKRNDTATVIPVTKDGKIVITRQDGLGWEAFGDFRWE